MKENILQVKSLSFAIDSVNLYKTPNEKKEFILSKQLLRSGTSIGQISGKRIMLKARRILYIIVHFPKRM